MDEGWWEAVSGSVRRQLGLREVLLPARKAELNEKLRAEDKLQMKWTLFLSTFVLFNFSLGSVYWLWRGSVGSRVLRGSVLGLGFCVCAYKLGVEWLNLEFLRMMERERTDVAYFMRKLVLEQCKAEVLEGRSGILQRMND
jgi:hypothetical protein